MRFSWIALVCALGLVGCDDDKASDEDGHADEGHHGDATAPLEITAYGEAYAEHGIPAEDFADGWAVSFSKFEVVIADVAAADHEFAGPFTADLAADSMGQGHVLTTHEVPEGHHPTPGFAIERLTVEGTATLADATKTFAWVFEAAEVYSACESVVHVHSDGTEHEGADGRFEITLHADQLFFDALGGETPDRRFAALAAADADADGIITQAELAAAALPPDYTGADASVADLWAWIAAQAATLARANGEDPCTITPR